MIVTTIAIGVMSYTIVLFIVGHAADKNQYDIEILRSDVKRLSEEIIIIKNIHPPVMPANYV